MREVALLQQFLSKSDEEIAQFVKQYGIELSIEEIKRLRPIAEKASVTWLFTGIPHTVLEKIETIIGKRKLKQLLKFLEQ